MPQTHVTSEPIPASTAQKPGLTWLKVRRFLLRRLLSTILLLTVYVLSIGPMWWVWYSGMYVETEANYWVIAIYEPLRQACRIEWVNSAMTSYIEWWNL
ncbi:MAG: hypothetical protein NT013_05940 [Planctomycetia bacterium]|nr:hypothetical protein [Planctomycetia bacterium]